MGLTQTSSVNSDKTGVRGEDMLQIIIIIIIIIIILEFGEFEFCAPEVQKQTFIHQNQFLEKNHYS